MSAPRGDRDDDGAACLDVQSRLSSYAADGHAINAYQQAMRRCRSVTPSDVVVLDGGCAGLVAMMARDVFCGARVRLCNVSGLTNRTLAAVMEANAHKSNKADIIMNSSITKSSTGNSKGNEKGQRQRQNQEGKG